MGRENSTHIERHLSAEELQNIITKNDRILKRLNFIYYRYLGDSVDEACLKVGADRTTGYRWQERWNKFGYAGLVPKFSGGRPSKLSSEDKQELKHILEENGVSSSEEVREVLKLHFGVDYCTKQIRAILRELGLNAGNRKY